MPIRRTEWEEKIKETIKDFDVTVIKASSGQGKSTLAWQVCKNISSDYYIYELTWCADKQYIGKIIQYLKSKTKVGEIPIIVLDGLNEYLSNWNELAKRVHDLPVKFLITTREEDWYNYNGNFSELTLKTININMSFEEAEDIYLKFKEKNEVHNSITDWQNAWEKVEDRGLLIEYVYLLTQGEMMKERLENQIYNLNSQRDNKAKIEILRLVSIADVLNVKLKSCNLLKYIKSKIGFESDRGLLIKSIEKEYYIKLNDNYIKGLHPVRSKHLLDLVHEYIPVEESLENLLPLLSEGYIHNFCFNAPTLISDHKKEEFYSKLAQYFISQPYKRIVKAIEGIFSSAVLEYWKKNKKIFNEVDEHGGLSLLVFDVNPWADLNSLERLNNSIDKENKNIKFIISKMEQLEEYKKENFDAYIFAEALNELFADRKLKSNFAGLGDLTQWFKQFEIDFELLKEIKDLRNEKFYKILVNLNDSKQLIYACYLSTPEFYSQFISDKKNDIIGLLKKKTDSVVIEENNSNINIKYLLYDKYEKANDNSVKRIKTIYHFFPSYSKYCTEAITPDFPEKEIYTNVIDESIKKMPPENIPGKFEIHLNELWNKTILSRYEFDSIYRWQKYWYELREDALEFIKTTNKLIEKTLENNQNNIREISVKMGELREKIINSLIVTNRFPKQDRPFQEKTIFQKELKKLNDWSTSLRNSVVQVSKLLDCDDEYINNLIKSNFIETKQKLKAMQKSFNKICNETFDYFNYVGLESKEEKWYSRLINAIIYYIEEGKDKRKVYNARDTISTWYRSVTKKEVRDLNKSLKNIEENINYELEYPSKFIQDGLIRKIVVGIKNFDYKNFEIEFENILINLMELLEFNFNSLILVFIKNNESNKGIVISRKFIEMVKRDEWNEKINFPIPKIINEDILEPLKEVSLKPKSRNIVAENSMKFLIELWKISKYRKYLNSKNDLEKEWLSELELECKNKADNHLNHILEEVEKNRGGKYKNLLERVFQLENELTDKEFKRNYFEILHENK